MSWGMFRAVPTLEVPSLFLEAMSVLRPAFEGPGLSDRFTAGDVLSRLTDERWNLWVFEMDGRVTTAAITALDIYPRLRALRIVAIAGTGFQLWREWLADIAEFAAEKDCREIIGDGRLGWQRIVPMRRLGVSYSANVETLRRQPAKEVANG